MLYLFSQLHFTAVSPAEQPRATNYTINLHGFPENSCTNAQIQLTDKNEHFAHFQIFGNLHLPFGITKKTKQNPTTPQQQNEEKKDGLFPCLWSLLTV